MSAIDEVDEVSEVRAQLSAEGGIAQTVNNFQVREEQLTMAEAVARTAIDGGTAVIEAGTGTGKTFAYLVPALMLGEKVIISTGTRNLQNQLFYKDLPVVREALQKPVVTALLKGRSNYLCRYRLEQHRFIKHMFSRQQTLKLEKIELWAQATRDGDISELAELPESDSVWSYATSSADNCLGQDCPYIDDCHLNKARKAALDADLVVINHHLFFADALMREEGFGELLPEADLIILDEAHQLADVASHFFGMTFSSRKIKRLCSDIDSEARESAHDMGDLLDVAESLPPIVDRFQRGLESSTVAQKGAWLEVAEHPNVVGHLEDLGQGLKELAECMKEAGVRSRGLQSCERRLNELLALYRVITTPEVKPEKENKSSAGSKKSELSADEGSNDLSNANEMSNYVQWFERFKNSFSIHSTPLSVAEAFSIYRKQFQASWVFTSATLSVSSRFDSFIEPLGLEPTCQLQLNSPFDFGSQACLYVPKGLPEPRTPTYTGAVVSMAIPLLTLMQGRTFMLFTSHAALQEAAQLLEGELDFPLLVQGTLSKAELLRQFRELGNAVLLATGDFWEGVDVRGSALSCVIIDKLPFASPGEPVIKAKIDRIKELGGNPFISYQVPSAVIGLKQGVGRLIRDVTDRGLLVLCDPRLVNSRYGSIFLKSLPPMPLQREWAPVASFIVDNLLGKPDASMSDDASDCGEPEDGERHEVHIDNAENREKIVNDANFDRETDFEERL